MEWFELVKGVLQLGSEIVIVVAFLHYLSKRDDNTKILAQEGHEVVRELAHSFHDLKEAISIQTEVYKRTAEHNTFERQSPPQ